MRLWLTPTSIRSPDRSVGRGSGSSTARSGVAESRPGSPTSWLRFVRNRIVPIDAALRAPSPEPDISGHVFVSELRVDLSAASTRPGKRRPAATAAGIELMHLEELGVRGQAHPRSSARRRRVRGAQCSTRPPALMFLATARPAARHVATVPAATVVRSFTQGHLDRCPRGTPWPTGEHRTRPTTPWTTAASTAAYSKAKWAYTYCTANFFVGRVDVGTPRSTAPRGEPSTRSGCPAESSRHLWGRSVTGVDCGTATSVHSRCTSARPRRPSADL